MVVCWNKTVHLKVLFLGPFSHYQREPKRLSGKLMAGYVLDCGSIHDEDRKCSHRTSFSQLKGSISGEETIEDCL